MSSIKHLIYLFILAIFVILGISWYSYKSRELQRNLDASHLPFQNILAKAQGVSLDGQSLIFYHIHHLNWPEFHVRRAQIQNTPGNFMLQLKGFQANLLNYFKHQPSSQFQQDLKNYAPHKNLLDSALLSLAILGYDDICLDISTSVKQTAPNQISLELMVFEQGTLKLHLNGKTTASNDTDYVIHAINNKNITYHILYIHPEWKERLDIYTQSKDLPFLTENVPYKLNLKENGI